MFLFLTLGYILTVRNTDGNTDKFNYRISFSAVSYIGTYIIPFVNPRVLEPNRLTDGRAK